VYLKIIGDDPIIAACLKANDIRHRSSLRRSASDFPALQLEFDAENVVDADVTASYAAMAVATHQQQVIRLVTTTIRARFYVMNFERDNVTLPTEGTTTVGLLVDQLFDFLRN